MGVGSLVGIDNGTIVGKVDGQVGADVGCDEGVNVGDKFVVSVLEITKETICEMEPVKAPNSTEI